MLLQVVNDEGAVELARVCMEMLYPHPDTTSQDVAKTVVEQDRVLEAKATMGGEDFAYFAEKYTCAFLLA